jgi:hypothetical protein
MAASLPQVSQLAVESGEVVLDGIITEAQRGIGKINSRPNGAGA